MAEFSTETFETFIRDASSLTEGIWMEVFSDRLELDMEAFVQMEGANALRTFVARDLGKVVGFVLVLVQDSLMQKTIREAIGVGMGVVPEYRRGWFAKNLVSYAEGELKNEGVRFINLTAAEGTQTGELLCGLGYAPVETIYQKEL